MHCVLCVNCKACKQLPREDEQINIAVAIVFVSLPQTRVNSGPKQAAHTCYNIVSLLMRCV